MTLDLGGSVDGAAKWNSAIKDKVEEGWSVIFTDRSRLLVRQNTTRCKGVSGWAEVLDHPAEYTGWSLAAGWDGKGERRSGSLGQIASVHDAEVKAIAEALKIDIQSDIRLIFSDSQAAIQTVLSLSEGASPTNAWNGT